MTAVNSDQFSVIYRTWAPRIFNHYRRMSWEHEEASDLTSEVFRIAWSRHAELREHSKVGAWLLVIADRLAANRVRSEDRRHMREHEAALAVAETRSRETSVQRLRRAFNSLPERDRQLLLWRDYSGLSYAEISELTNQSIEGVRTALYRARLQLREEFQKRWE